MYSVNCGVPKTLVRHLIEYYASVTTSPELARLLLDVNATPVFQNCSQACSTQNILGNYELHDFPHYFLKYGEPNGLLALAMQIQGRLRGRSNSTDTGHFCKTLFLAAVQTQRHAGRAEDRDDCIVTPR